MRNLKKKLRIFLVAFMLSVFGNSLAHANESVRIIVDAELESVLRTFLDPMLTLVGISPQSISIMIVDSPVINASAVAGGILVLNTALLVKVTSLEQLLGVLAHEVGHFLGAHHARHDSAMERSTSTMIAGALLGGLALAIGKPDVAMAAVFGGQHIAIRSYLEHRRGEESSADQSAVEILDRLNISCQGLVDFMKLLSSEDLRTFSRQDAYLLTHPLSHERMMFFQNHLAHTTQRATPTEWALAWAKAQAKLKAFLMDPERIISAVGFSNATPDLYALAVAYHRKVNLEKATEFMRMLLEREPNNPFFHELQGQVLFERGHIKEALPFYEKALALSPKSAILKILASHALIEEGSSASLQKAEAFLNHLVETDRKNIMAWHFLGVAQGKQNKIGLSALSLAEKALLTEDLRTAHTKARVAVESLPPKTPQWQRAKDVLDSLGSNSRR